MSGKLRHVERELLRETYGRSLALLRLLPAHALRITAGIALPPHERYWLQNYFCSYGENITIGSRGTSKTFTFGSAAPALDTLLFKGQDTLIVSASGFRGGKLIMEDMRRLVNGELRSQKLPAPYLRKSADTPKIIRQEPDRWIAKWTSYSQAMTVPSNNADAMRGIRAIKAVIDEWNFFDNEVVQKVIGPMMNVGGEFEKIASSVTKNSTYKSTTIDYTFRPAWKEIDTMRRTAQRQYEAMQALQDQEYARYNQLMGENKQELVTASFQYSRFDYTDLLIATEITDPDDGITYTVNYPLPGHLSRSDIVKYDDRDQVAYYYTYPVAKAKLEESLLNGTMDEDLWLAENRNVFIEASGSIYPDALVKKAGEVPIHEAGELAGRKGMEAFDEEFFAPVLRTCGDPCVLGVDYAREKDDFAFVVFRLGPLAEGPFTPFGREDKQGRPCYGQTPWSSVVWAESWPHTMSNTAADALRDVLKRFNIVAVHGGAPEDPGGMALDKRGGGSAVRDDLASPKPPVLPDGTADPTWTEPVKLYDPNDTSYQHFRAQSDQTKYWDGLRLVTPTNAENWEWTRYTKAAMEQGQLYLGYWEAAGTWAQRLGILTQTGQRDQDDPRYAEWIIGYNALKKLRSQLVRLQTQQTTSGLTRVYMPGKKGTEEGKKDLYSAFIYGWALARDHLVRATKPEAVVPTVQPILIQSSVRRNYTSIGWGE